MILETTRGALGNLARRKRIMAGERIKRCPQHEVAGAAAHTAIDPDGGLLLGGSAARLKIATVKLAPEQSLEMCRLELLDQIAVARDDLSHARQAPGRIEDSVDRDVEPRRDQRPGVLHETARSVIEAEMLETSFESFENLGLSHGVSAPTVCDVAFRDTMT